MDAFVLSSHSARPCPVEPSGVPPPKRPSGIDWTGSNNHPRTSMLSIHTCVHCYCTQTLSHGRINPNKGYIVNPQGLAWLCECQVSACRHQTRSDGTDIAGSIPNSEGTCAFHRRTLAYPTGSPPRRTMIGRTGTISSLNFKIKYPRNLIGWTGYRNPNRFIIFRARHTNNRDVSVAEKSALDPLQTPRNIPTAIEWSTSRYPLP